MTGKHRDQEQDAATPGRWVIDATGIPGLDAVLGGGLPRGALVSIVGQPGSGKTVLAGQMAFAAARAGRRVVFFTALSESTYKIVAHLRGFDFFDEQVLGDAVQVFSIQRIVAEGLKAASNEMVAVTRQARANLLLLDGFSGVRGADQDPQAARQFLYDLGTTLGMLGTTVVISGEAMPRDPALFSEVTTADAVLGLHYRLVGVRQQRGIEATKVRGAAPLPGLHALTLDQRGVTIYPRLETLVSAPQIPATQPTATSQPTGQTARVPADHSASGAARERASLGFAELDALLGGGLTSGTTALVAGSFGTGKTLLALNFLLAGARVDEPGVLLTFQETEDQLSEKARPFAFASELRAATAPGGGLTILRYPPVDVDADRVAAHLLETLDRTGARRLAVDSVVEIERAASWGDSAGRVTNFLSALMELMRAQGITTIFTKEIHNLVGREVDFSDTPISVLAENLLLLQQVEHHARMRRVLAVLKMRFSAYDASIREFTIAPPEGIRVLAPSESETEMLGSFGPLGQAEKPRAGTRTFGVRQQRGRQPGARPSSRSSLGEQS